MTETIQLLNREGVAFANCAVREERDWFRGRINPADLTHEQRAIFEELEEIGNGQIISLLDEIEDKIDGLGIKVKFADGTVSRTTALHIFPNDETIAFKAESIPAGVTT